LRRPLFESVLMGDRWLYRRDDIEAVTIIRKAS
jgi:hypothetical protein